MSYTPKQKLSISRSVLKCSEFHSPVEALEKQTWVSVISALSITKIKKC